MKFEVEIEKEKIEAYLKVLKTTGDEVKVTVDPKQGLTCKAVDDAHVMMVVADLEPHAFINWDVEAGDLGLDLDKILGAMKFMGAIVKIKLTDSGQISMSSERIKRRMAQIDTAGLRDPKIPSLTFTSSFRMKTSDLKSICKGANSISSILSIHLHKQGLMLKGEGDTDSIEMVFEKKDLVKHILGNDESSSKSTYPLDFVQTLANQIKDDEVTFSMMGDDQPIKMVWNMPGDGGKADALLAPRIAND